MNSIVRAIAKFHWLPFGSVIVAEFLAGILISNNGSYNFPVIGNLSSKQFGMTNAELTEFHEYFGNFLLFLSVFYLLIKVYLTVFNVPREHYKPEFIDNAAKRHFIGVFAMVFLQWFTMEFPNEINAFLSGKLGLSLTARTIHKYNAWVLIANIVVLWLVKFYIIGSGQSGVIETPKKKKTN